MIDSEEPKKEKTLKYMHYYPRFLIKNFCKITEKYDLYTKKYSSKNLTIKYIGSQEIKNPNLQKEFYKIEKEEDSKITQKNETIESFISKIIDMKKLTLKEFDKNPKQYLEDRDKFEKKFIEKFKSKYLIKFIRHLLVKSPKLRASLASIKYSESKYVPKEIEINSPNYEFISYMMKKEHIKEIEKIEINKIISHLGNKNNLDTILLSCAHSIPLIDPGYNFFKINEYEEYSFILQLNEYSFLILGQKEIIDEIEEHIGIFEKQKNYEHIANFFVSLMVSSNTLLKNIYFSEETL